VRKWTGLLAVAALLLLMAVPAGARDKETVRVMIKGGPQALAAAKAQGFASVFEFSGMYSSEVPVAALDRLAAIQGVTYELVGQAYLLGAPVGQSGTSAKAKPGGGRSAFPEDPTPWGIESVYNNQSITSTSGGAGVIVAILDTGVASHLDLKAPVQCKDFTSRTGVKDGTCSDGNGHGTHVTGTILASGGADGLGIWGVAPEANYFAYKVLGNSGSGSWDGLAAAIRTAADNGANIISMSLGGSSAPTYVQDAIDYAYGKGTLVVAAAGNSGPNVDTIEYPGAYANAVAVAAIEMISGNTGSGDSTSLSNLRITSFSSRGAANSSGADGIQEREVEIAGPGAYVESTSNQGGYVKYSGTSMATPHMAGLAAKNWQGGASQTRNWLQNQAKKYDVTQANSGGAGTGYDYASGYGGPRN
jgi:subtilisin